MVNAIITGLNLLGTGLKGFFGLKKSQAQVMDKALKVVSDVNKSDDARAVAAAQIISAEARSESWLTRSWRPLVVVTFVCLLVAHLLGFTAVNLTETVLMRLFDIVEYSVLGYMGMRTTDKLVRELQIGGILKEFIKKKLG